MPQPVAPTSATVSPGREVEVDVAQDELVGLVGEGEVDVLEAQVTAVGGRRSAAVPSTMSGSVSKISRMRAAAVIASCAIARITPSEATGHTSESIRVMKATSSPGVSAPRPTPMAPSSSTTTTARLGITSRKVQNRADSRTLSMLVACSLRAAAVVLARDVLAAAEGLDHADADRALLGAGGQVALLVLHPPRQHDVALLEAHREPHDRRGGDGDDQAERPVHVQQHDRSRR